MMTRPSSTQAGFTLIELMVSLVVAMVILAGLYSNFIMQSRVQASQSSTVESVEDLRLAAQVMEAPLRTAVNVCWDATNGLVYQPLGSTVTMTGCSGTVDISWGAFRFSNSASTGGKVCWDRPNNGQGCQELLRGLDPTNGFTVSPGSPVANLGVLRTITLVSQYQNADRQNKTLSISFDVLPRNH